MLKSRSLLFFFVFISSSAGAQILNDSTVNVYGPKSTGFFYERDLYSDDSTLHHPDTLINGFHYMSTNKANGWFWQDLGNEGTASRTLYFSTPENAFTESGYTSFAPFYAPKVKDIKYFDTHSPYTAMAYVQNSRKMTNLGLTHSQNIMANWNMTLNVNRILSAKQFSAETSEDRLVEHWNYTLNTNFTSKNKKYRLLAALMHFNHIQHEQGGISVFGQAVDSLQKTDIEGDYNTEYQERLTEVKSRERWNDFHLFHQMKLLKGISVYHSFDFQHHKYFYTDTLVQTNNKYSIYPDVDSTDQKIKNYYFFHNYQNRLGFRGFFRGFKYDLGLTARVYGLDARHVSRDKNSATEILVGGRAGYWFSDSSIFLDNELHIGYGSQNKGNFYLNSELKIKNYELGFRQVSKPAPLLYTQFASPAISWESTKLNVNSTSVYAQARVKTKRMLFVPKMTMHWVSNYLYFGNSLLPQQSDKNHLIVNPDILFALDFDHWKIQNRLIINWVGGDSEIFALPFLMNNLNVEYNFLYADVLRIYLGTDIYFRPGLRGLAYSPLIQNFYFDPKAGDILGVPVADIYTNFMIKRVKLAFGFNYINKGFPTKGFFSTPNYLGMGRAFYLKVNWPLFN